jgi:ATP phosphoribosyltransferase
LLIEGTETGKTLVENNLKSIDVLFLSTTCVIVRKDAAAAKQPALERLLSHLGRAATAAESASATIRVRG